MAWEIGLPLSPVVRGEHTPAFYLTTGKGVRGILNRTHPCRYLNPRQAARFQQGWIRLRARQLRAGRILNMGATPVEKSEFKVIPTPRLFWLRRWWLWFLVVAFVSIFACYQWNAYQKEKFNRYLLELDQHGIKVEVILVNEQLWLLPYVKHLPSFVAERLASQKTSVIFVGDEITADSLRCLEKMPTVTSITFKDTPNLEDASFAHLAHLQSLTQLDLINTPISEAVIIHLQNLPKLSKLTIEEKNSLSESVIDQLLVMKPTIYVHVHKAESVKAGVLEMISSSGSQSVNVGDYIGFRGSFTSTHFVPDHIFVTYYQPSDRTDVFGFQIWRNTAGTRGEITSGTNDIYQFSVDTSFRFRKAGQYKAKVELVVKNSDQNSSSEISFVLGVKEFEVKKE